MRVGIVGKDMMSVRMSARTELGSGILWVQVVVVVVVCGGGVSVSVRVELNGVTV